MINCVSTLSTSTSALSSLLKCRQVTVTLRSCHVKDASTSPAPSGSVDACLHRPTTLVDWLIELRFNVHARNILDTVFPASLLATTEKNRLLTMMSVSVCLHSYLRNHTLPNFTKFSVMHVACCRSSVMLLWRCNML